MGTYLGGEVLEDGGEVDGGAGADALGVAALLEVAPDAADGKLEPGLHGAGHRLLPVASLPSGHLACCFSGDEDSRGVLLAAVALDRDALSLWIWTAARARLLLDAGSFAGGGSDPRHVLRPPLDLGGAWQAGGVIRGSSRWANQRAEICDACN